MNAIIQRAAMAMCRQVEADLAADTGDHAWQTLGHSSLDSWVSAVWPNYVSQARAAIAAMREPAQEMMEAGFQHTGDPCWPANVGNAWRAMIDFILKETP